MSVHTFITETARELTGVAQRWRTEGSPKQAQILLDYAHELESGECYVPPPDPVVKRFLDLVDLLDAARTVDPTETKKLDLMLSNTIASLCIRAENVLDQAGQVGEGREPSSGLMTFLAKFRFTSRVHNSTVASARWRG